MFSNIVAGTDGSPTAAVAVQVAAELAASSKARLHLVRAYRLPSQLMGSTAPEAGFGLVEADAKLVEDVGNHLDVLAKTFERNGLDVEVHARPQAAADAIIEVAARCGADLVVVGNRGMQGKRRLLGSVPNSVTHRAPCAVLVVPTVHRDS